MIRNAPHSEHKIKSEASQLTNSSPQECLAVGNIILHAINETLYDKL